MKKEHVIILSLTGAALVLTGIVIVVKAKGKGSGGWIKPVTGPLTSGFGLRKDPLNSSVIQGHNGQDIGVPANTPVKNPYPGSVVDTTPTTDGGNQVIIKHNNGWFTGYAHLNKVLVTKGQTLKKGQVFALSGNTGAHTTAPHLHFTMTDPQGNKKDPKLYVYNPTGVKSPPVA